jgi:hypothetical protein
MRTAEEILNEMDWATSDWAMIEIIKQAQKEAIETTLKAIQKINIDCVEHKVNEDVVDVVKSDLFKLIDGEE